MYLAALSTELHLGMRSEPTCVGGSLNKRKMHFGIDLRGKGGGGGGTTMLLSMPMSEGVWQRAHDSLGWQHGPRMQCGSMHSSPSVPHIEQNLGTRTGSGSMCLSKGSCVSGSFDGTPFPIFVRRWVMLSAGFISASPTGVPPPV